MVSTFDSLDARLRRLPDVAIFVIGMALIAGISVFKLTAGRDIPVADFLLIPVAAIGWLTRTRAYAYLAASCTAVVTVILAVSGQADAPLAAALVAAAVRFCLYLIVLELLAGIRAMQLAREREARMDFLTATVNVRAFQEIARTEIERGRRYSRPLSLLYLDLDNFKAINDQFGHGAGDLILAELSHVLRCSVRSADIVARLGGDEFAVLMPETDRFAAVRVAQRVREELLRVTAPDGQPVRCSVGVASYAGTPASLDVMIHDADALMYRAKREGKDRVESAEFDTHEAVLHVV